MYLLRRNIKTKRLSDKLDHRRLGPFTIKEKTDLVIAGLGWVTIQKPGTVSVWSPKEVDVIQRQSII